MTGEKKLQEEGEELILRFIEALARDAARYEFRRQVKRETANRDDKKKGAVGDQAIIDEKKSGGNSRIPTDKLQDNLAYPPRGLRASRAAAYLGMSQSSFLSLVNEGLMPQPKRVKGMSIWDRYALDAAFDRLSKDENDPPTKRKNTMDVIMGLDADDHPRGKRKNMADVIMGFDRDDD